MPEALVIGGGVMGLSAARELRKRNYSVTLLDRAQPGRAASWASAGIIGATLRDESSPTFELRQVSRRLWPAFAAEVQAQSEMDPEYRESGCLQLATREAELAAVRGAGARDPEATYLDAAQLRELEPAVSSRVAGGLLVAGGSVEPRRLCRALELAARRCGVTLHAGAEVRALASSGGRVTGVATAESRFSADMVVVAAGAWSETIDELEPRPPIRPQRGQILALDQSRVGVRHVLLTPGDPYFVPRVDGRLVIGATREEAGWDASLTAGGVAWLLNRAIEVVPALEACPIQELWTGFRPVSEDGLPLIGRGALDGLFFLTGHGPSGIAPLPGSLAVLMACIDGAAPPMAAAAFDPLRFRR